MCERQNSVTEEVTRNISDIRDFSNTCAQTAEDSSKASRNFSELSHELLRLLGCFRVEGMSTASKCLKRL